MGGDLGCQGAVAAAEVQDIVAGLGVQPADDFGGEFGDEGSGCRVGFLCPVVFGWLSGHFVSQADSDGQGGLRSRSSGCTDVTGEREGGVKRVRSIADVRYAFFDSSLRVQVVATLFSSIADIGELSCFDNPRMLISY